MKKSLLLLFSLFPLLCVAQSDSVLVMSDVHIEFNKPFTTFYHKDADTTLFLSATGNAKGGKYSFIIMPGDLLSHDTAHQEKKMTRDLTYIIKKVQDIDKKAVILPALGNNDLLHHDIPDTATYRIFYNAALKNIDKGGSIAKTFKFGGYYAYKKGTLTVLVLNTVIFTAKGYRPEANSELTWLEATLRDRYQKKQPVWIVYHIPPGHDRYAKTDPWRTDLSARFVRSIKKYAPIIKFQQAGHTHMVDAELINEGTKLISYIAIAPGLCTRNGNNPAYQVVGFDHQNYSINHIRTYYTNPTFFSSDLKWHSFDMKDLGFKFILEGGDDSKTGKEFVAHYSAYRGPLKASDNTDIAWDGDFRRSSKIPYH